MFDSHTAASKVGWLQRHHSAFKCHSSRTISNALFWVDRLGSHRPLRRLQDKRPKQQSRASIRTRNGLRLHISAAAVCLWQHGSHSAIGLHADGSLIETRMALEACIPLHGFCFATQRPARPREGGNVRRGGVGGDSAAVIVSLALSQRRAAIQRASFCQQEE